MGEEGGYTMIFNSLQSGLVYINPTIDITDEIVRRVDEASPAEPF
jgi:Skp family chaperone for outer membrane proteins